jgi:hypothetical protein
MNSKVLHKAFIPKGEKREAIIRITDAIASQEWFGSQPVDRSWLLAYLSNLYDHGLVLQDELALCGLAAAKHRFCCESKTSKGAYLPEEISLMGELFGRANRNPTWPQDSEQARALARRVIRLYSAG